MDGAFIIYEFIFKAKKSVTHRTCSTTKMFQALFDYNVTRVWDDKYTCAMHMFIINIYMILYTYSVFIFFVAKKHRYLAFMCNNNNLIFVSYVCFTKCSV